MAYKLTTLPKTSFSGLDYDNIITDIVNLVKDNPEYNDSWDDFLSSDAGRMLTELFAYITDQLATRVDWIVNEHFIGTATQKRSVVRMLKLIGYKFSLPIASTVGVSINFDRAVGDFTLTDVFNPNDDDSGFKPYTLTAKDKSGISRNFECVNYNETTEKYDYLSSIVLNTGTTLNSNLNHKVDFYEGTTYIETFTAITDNNPIFELNKKSIIEGSVSVFIVQEDVGSPVVELLEVKSFLDPEAQKSEDIFGNHINIPYLLNVIDEDGVSIEFAPMSLLPSVDRRLIEGDKIRVIYRVGGGKAGNITKQAINKTSKISVNTGSEIVIVNTLFKNEEEGIGGEESETIEHAAAYAPLNIRTVEKTVTENDYDILLNSQNTILKTKTYGANNMPEDIYEKYGIFIKPLEVWNYILRARAGWEKINPSDYNDYQWTTLRKENRFNEKHYLKYGKFGNKTSINTSSFIESEALNVDGIGNKDYFNFIYISMKDEYKENYLLPSMKVKFTTEENKDSYYYNLKDYNFFNEKLVSTPEINSTNYSIYSPVNSAVTGTTNLSNKINVDLQVLDIVLDNITLDTSLILSGSSETALSIAAQINAKYASDANFGNNIVVNKGYQTITFGSSPTTATVTDLTANTDYYFYINEEEFKITTGSSSPTIDELTTLINNSFVIHESTGTVTFGSYDITNIIGIDKIEKGYKFTIDNEVYSDSSEDVIDIYNGESRFRVNTLGDHTDNVSLKFYKYYCSFDNITGLKILNNKSLPNEGIILRKGITGSDLYSNIIVGDETINSPQEGGDKTGFHNLGLNVTLTDNAGLVNNANYNFIINNYLYTITAADTDTYNDIITKMNTAVSPNFSVTDDTNDIRITSVNYNYVELRDGILASDLVYALHTAPYIFSSADTIEGGGDYSAIASVYYGTNGAEYLKIKSPSKGVNASNIFIPALASNIFGGVRVNTVFKGINKVTLISDPNFTDPDKVGDFVLEIGNLNTPYTEFDIYNNYLIKENQVIEIGKYFSQFDVTDPKYRDIADRIYNTIYDDDGNIDFINSKFEIRFTKEPTTKNSIFAITSDWDLEQSSPANISSVNMSSIGSMDTNYNITISINNQAFITIDLTGDNGVTHYPDVTTIVNNINEGLNTEYGTSYLYAKKDDVTNTIVIKSNSYKNDSKIELGVPVSNDATNLFFNLTNGENHVFLVNGDYYLEYDAETIVDGVLTGIHGEERNYLKLLPVVSSTKIPDLEFYVSFIFDRTIVPGIYDGLTEETNTSSGTTIVGVEYGKLDEDIYSEFLDLKKIVGINNIFKETIFSTFDISGTVYYNEVYSKSTIQESVEDKIEEEYNIKNRDYAQIVSRSKIMNSIHEIPGVIYVEVDYLGKNYNDINNNPNEDNTIECDFNEILILSEKKYYFGVQINGMIFNYKPIKG